MKWGLNHWTGHSFIHHEISMVDTDTWGVLGRPVLSVSRGLHRDHIPSQIPQWQYLTPAFVHIYRLLPHNSVIMIARTVLDIYNPPLPNNGLLA